MLKEKQTQSNIGVGLGIVFNILAVLMQMSGSKPLAVLGLLVGIAGAILFVWGCIAYAQGKGYSAIVGILGLFGCIGLLILALLKDRNPSINTKKAKRAILKEFE